MKCPNCKETLVMSERQGVEIDYCPQCRGVWLDKGELDKLIEKAAAYSSSHETLLKKDERKKYYDDDDDSFFNRQQNEKDSHYPRKKRGGFLGDFFDF